MCGCSQMTTTTMELPSLVCLCVLISCGVSSADANEPVKVTVMEEDDVILPCSLSTKEDIEFKLFDWKKDDQKEVFMYDGGVYYDNGLSGQDKQFKGRVSHFSHQLKNGNASIIIQNTMVDDSGNYTCDFPRLQPEPQTFHIELVVIADDILKRRNISGAAPEPYITIIDQTSDWSLLQCAVRGAFPEPKVEWKDSSGNIVPAKKSQVTKRGDKYDIILKATVTKTDNFSCVATQEEIHHQIESQIFVHINEKPEKISQGPPIGWIATAVSVICILAAAGILLGVLFCKGFIKINRQSKTGSSKNPTTEEQNLNSSHNQTPEA